MHVITLINEKGGVGKTSISINLAAGLALRGKRVLLLDTDAQEANASRHMRLPRSGGLYQLLVHEAEWKDVLAIPTTEVWAGEIEPQGTLWMLPSNLESRVIPMMIEDVTILAERLKELKDRLDYVIIDTSPTPSLLHAMIYLASDYMIYPTQAELPSIQGLASSINHMERAKKTRVAFGLKPTELLGVQPTMYRSNTDAHKHGLGMIQKQFGDLTWQPIAARIIWGEATFSKETIFAYDPNNIASKEMWRVVDNVLEGVGA